MPLPGQATISIRKKDLQRERNVTVGFKKLVFAHKATAGETGIDLSSLVTPTEMSTSGFVQPTYQELQTAKLSFYRKNFKLVSSHKGTLIDYVSYVVPTNSRIDFVDFTAEEGELFIGIIDHEPVTGISVVDASPLVVTGTLLAGQQDINVGEPFEYFKFPTQQVGAVKLFLDGSQQFRNVGNVTADPLADGNYQEVQSVGTGTSSILRVNDIDYVNDRSFLVVSTGLLYNRPSASRDAALEALQATVDSMVPVLADAAGVPESAFQSAPSQADLAAFALRVFQLENYREVSSTDDLTARTGRSPVDKVRFDTTSGAGVYVLPSNPVTGQYCELWDSKSNWGTAGITIDRNGHLIEGAAADFTVSTNDVRLRLVYDGPSRGWLIGDLT